MNRSEFRHWVEPIARIGWPGACLGVVVLAVVAAVAWYAAPVIALGVGLWLADRHRNTQPPAPPQAVHHHTVEQLVVFVDPTTGARRTVRREDLDRLDAPTREAILRQLPTGPRP